MTEPDESALHLAVRKGNSELVLEVIGGMEGLELKHLLGKQNQLGQTALYVAAESGNDDLVKHMVKYYIDVGLAGIKARNGYDAFHIAAKQADLKVLNVLMEANSELAMTFDSSNTTPLHTAALLGHLEVIHFLLEKGSGVAIATTNGKTPLHSAARNGHLEIVKALLSKEDGLGTKIDKKGQTALHMAVKGHKSEMVYELIKSDPSIVNMVDTNGNTALHVAVRKGRVQVVRVLLDSSRFNKAAINKSGETALDTANKTGHTDVAAILQQHGIQCARFMKPTSTDTARELKQTVNDINHNSHDRHKHTSRARNKMHEEGLNNAINSTTVVAILIATVAFAAIFNVPGQFMDNPQIVPLGDSVGQARVASRPAFLIFVVFDSFALFISLAVVIVQTSVVVIERKAKKQMMAVINKLMWLACVLISIAFLSLSYVVIGDNAVGLAICVTVIGTVIMVSTLGTMCYWVIVNRVEASNSIRRLSIRRSRMLSDSEGYENGFKKLYAV